MVMTGRSDCPINLASELLGDRWSLVILRDIIFADRRRFRVLLSESEEGIASNILAGRLRELVEGGLLHRSGDVSHKQKVVYSLTESAIEFLPTMISMGAWANSHLAANPIIGRWFAFLYEQGPRVWDELADDLRHRHLDGPSPKSSAATMDTMTVAYRRQIAVTAPRQSGSGDS